MDKETGNCPVCNSGNTLIHPKYDRNTVFFACPVCGRYELDLDLVRSRDMNHLASYLFYHAFPHRMGIKPCFHTELLEEYCAQMREAYNHGNTMQGYPYHIDAQIVENWYPKSFPERIDRILMYLGEHEKHFGETQKFTQTEIKALFFVDFHEYDSEGKNTWRHETDCISEIRKNIQFLEEGKFASVKENSNGYFYISIESEGYNRIDYLQKNQSSSKNALVAMEFSDNTKPVREAIRKGITDAGYNPIIYDEVENNDYIMPELLKSIRESRFVVVDLSDYNNGAYFEEGYAMGLGKAVIQICKKGTKLHFDAAQKNTIVFESTEELSERLMKRIKATIDS